jgi:hypothetical protein
MTQFAVIVEVGEGNHACGNLLINPNGKKHLAGSTFVVEPDLPKDEYEKLFVECLREESGRSSRNEELKTLDLTKKQLVTCLTPVFHLGEIMIIDSNDRTIPDGRKPSKWDVGCEYFDTIEKAIVRAEEVTK